MATIRTFEDLQVWQRSRILCKTLHSIWNRDRFKKDYSLKDQINGASGSVMDNVAEGFERDGKQEFIQFLYISKGSLGEVRSQLYRAYDRDYINQEELDALVKETIELAAMHAGLIKHIRLTDHKGLKKKDTK